MNTSPTTATAVNVSQLQTIEPGSITLLSENIGIVMESSVQGYASMKTKDIPTVRLGRVNGKSYAINHYDVILGCMQSKKNVRCIIEEYENISDVMVQHFRDVMSNDVINTPRIYSSVDSLQERLKTDKESVLKILGIDKNQYARLLTAASNMSEAAISQLEELVMQLSKRKGLTAIQASVPVYMLEKISRISDVKQQLKLIQIIEYDLHSTSDGRFFWMTPEQIDSILQLVRQDATHAENKREESTVAEFVDLEEIGKKPDEKKKKQSSSSATTETSSAASADSNDDDDCTSKQKQGQGKTNPKKKSTMSQKTRQIIDSIPNMLVIPDENGQPDILVDKKSGAVTRLDTKASKGIIKSEQIPSKRLYSIPLDVAKFLGMGDHDDSSSSSSTTSAIRHKNISGTEALKSFVESQKDQTQRYTIFWNAQ
ncbi:MAG: hypothetical protein OER82_00050 [Nitrosopumilus sp.]|nr:hypothetical protein [Nitrosopumilus sp.]